MTFDGLDGQQYEYDKWYPLPFIVKGLRMLPTWEEAQFLFIKLADGRVWQWRPFYSSEVGRHVRTATHWMCKRSGWFEI